MRQAVLLALAALAGCGSPERTPAPKASEAAVAPAAQPAPTASAAPSATPTLTPLPSPAPDLAVLDNRDCRTVAKAYFDAIGRGDFAFAARVWNDPVIDDARLRALFGGYKRPAVEVSHVESEGAAGSLYCTVTGALVDTVNTARPLQKGEIVLKRVNDVPGATPDQLRWTIRSSTFVEEMKRTG